MDQIILDFEENTITWNTDTQKGTEICPELSARKQQILAAMGYAPMNITPIVTAVEAYINGESDEAALHDALNKFAQEDFQ